MNITYLLLGSNEGDRVLWFQKASGLIATTCGTITRTSATYETAAWGITAQPDFLNKVLELQTDLSPDDLLAALLHIETILGRHRNVKWGPRTIDIDILLYNNDVIDTPSLVIPHPFLHVRRFTLAPLAELIPAYIHPVLRKTILQLLDECPDKLEVHKKDV
jgi:2-amino-4-hydroxy-6-hydroxymethyldihydropteridine diphosphokinase